MLILPRAVPHTWHMGLKQFILTVGLLIALATTETKAQAGRGYSSIATSVTAKTILSEPEHKFCNHTRPYIHRTRCMECQYGEFEPCSAGYHNVNNESCKIHFPWGYTVPGCRAVCIEMRVESKCCKGYWGKECRKCPGGSGKPCSGHGRCLVHSGQCVCDVGFHGKACELCQNKNKYGPDCSEDCTCAEWECNSGVYADGGCAPENPCNSSVSPCGTNSQCLHTGPGTHVCVCEEGYDDSSDEGSGSDTASDGDCVTDDPCQIDNGGCDSTQDCIPMGTAKWECRCKKGYEPDRRSTTCNLKDMCTPGLCGYIARCETREPLKPSCVCPGNYTWNGQTCSSNIIEVLGDLSAGDDKFVGTLQYMSNMTSRFYGTLLAEQGPFTIFVPTDKAFREGFGNTLQELFTDDIQMKKLLRQHIVIGRYTTAVPRKLYTLQGYEASLTNINEFNRKVSLYYVQSSNNSMKESVITAGDIVASNGLIHIINYVKGSSDNQFSNAETAMDLINRHPDYKAMASLIWLTGLHEIFSMPNTTVFISNNSAWARLSHEERKYLVSDPDGREELSVTLKNHVYPGVIDVAELIIRRNMESYANINVKVIIGRSGYIQLDDDGAKISLADIPFRTGLCHRVDKVLVPSYLQPLKKGRCEDNSTRVVQTSSCCEGFYGLHCLACPGGARNICSGNGKCHDGDLGTGKCTCTSNFTGTSCDRCKDKYNFGPRCDQACTCKFGLCDNGMEGTGKCQPGSCMNGHSGENCDLRLTPCESDDTCQLNANCYRGSDGNISCYCDRFYEEDGDNCVRIDFCRRNRCHKQASCSQVAFRVIKCTCYPGWHGSGFMCMPILPCYNDSHCHEDAVCHNTEPGQFRCVCKPGYRGNGKDCVSADPCILYNGSCNQQEGVNRLNSSDQALSNKEEYILEFSDHPDFHEDDHSWRTHAQALSHPAIAGVTAAVVVVLGALFAIVIYKRWKRLPRQPSTNLECNFKYTQIGRDETEDFMTMSIPENIIYQPSV